MGLIELLVDAALANSRGLFSATGVVDAERVAVLEVACTAVEGNNSPEEAQLLTLLALELTFSDDLPRRKHLIGKAVQIARNIGDEQALAWALSHGQMALNVPGTLDERREMADEAWDIAARFDDPSLHYLSLNAQFYPYFQAGDVVQGDQNLRLTQEVVERLGQPTYQWLLTNGQVCRALLSGDTIEAERLANVSFELGTATGQMDAMDIFATQFASIRLMQGRSEEIIELVKETSSANPGIPTFAVGLALFYCDNDRFDDARAVLASFVADGFRSLPMDMVGCSERVWPPTAWPNLNGSRQPRCSTSNSFPMPVNFPGLDLRPSWRWTTRLVDWQPRWVVLRRRINFFAVPARPMNERELRGAWPCLDWLGVVSYFMPGMPNLANRRSAFCSKPKRSVDLMGMASRNAERAKRLPGLSLNS